MMVFNPLKMSDLAACLPALNPGAIIAGGCTDLSVRFLKVAKPEQLLSIKLVSELRNISVVDGYLHIGAAVTLTELTEYPLPGGLAALKQAASDVGSKQIRNTATIGGNIMNASPAGDMLPCLFMFGSHVEYMKPDGSVCNRPIEDIVTGSGKTSLAYNEVLTAVKIPIPPENLYSAFWKLGFRKKVTIARINIAMSASASNDKIDEICFFMGAVAPVPARIGEAEKILLENKWNTDTCEKLTEYLSDMLKRTVPVEFDRDYKVFAIKGAIHDILQRFPYWAE